MSFRMLLASVITCASSIALCDMKPAPADKAAEYVEVVKSVMPDQHDMSCSMIEGYDLTRKTIELAEKVIGNSQAKVFANDEGEPFISFRVSNPKKSGSLAWNDVYEAFITTTPDYKQIVGVQFIKTLGNAKHKNLGDLRNPNVQFVVETTRTYSTCVLRR